MKIFKIKSIVGVLIVSLLIINIYLFGQTIVLGERILKIENDTKKLRIENSELAKKLYSLNSILSLEKNALILGFTQKSEPVYLENLQYVLAR